MSLLPLRTRVWISDRALIARTMWAVFTSQDPRAKALVRLLGDAEAIANFVKYLRPHHGLLSDVPSHEREELKRQWRADRHQDADDWWAEKFKSPGPVAERRLLVASMAMGFFRDSAIDPYEAISKAAIGAPPYSAADFVEWLSLIGTDPPLGEVMRVLLALERVGLLVSGGYKFSQQRLGAIYYVTDDDASRKGYSTLDLAEVLGEELVIPYYQPLTVKVTGYPKNPAVPINQDQKPLEGSGLIVGRRHVITNRHVVENMRFGIKVHLPERPPFEMHDEHLPAESLDVSRSQIRWIDAGPENIDYTGDDIDVAVIEFDFPPNQTYKLNPRHTRPRFRDPTLTDSVLVFGYPRAAMTTEHRESDDTVKVERGQVIQPLTFGPSTGNRPRPSLFLYSATTRPGNSGGPVVAADGRVIGLVVEDSDGAGGTGGNHPNQLPLTSKRKRIRMASLKTRRRGYPPTARAVMLLRGTQQQEPPAPAPPDTPATAPYYRGIPSSAIVKALEHLGVNIVSLDDWGGSNSELQEDSGQSPRGPGKGSKDR